MSRKNPNKKALDFSRSDHVNTALSILMSSSESEMSEDSCNYNRPEESWVNEKLDQIQNAQREDDILFNDFENNLDENEAVPEEESNGLPTPLSILESPLPRPGPSERISSEATPSLQHNDELETGQILEDLITSETDFDVDINSILEIQTASPVTEVEIPNIELMGVSTGSTAQILSPVPINQPSTSHNSHIPSMPRPSYASVQNRQRIWTTMVDDWNVPSFDKPLQVNQNYNNRSTVKDYFMDTFPGSILEMIVQNTNKYAHEKNARCWTDVTKEEISAYLGMMILASINPVPDSQLYWSTDPFYRNPVISEVMAMKRFKKITENLHISDITTELPKTSPDYDKLCKIRPLIQELNEKFREVCTSSQTQSIDESMIKFKGKSTMKQYMPKKPIKRGYKCWARCDSKTGYLYQFQFYSGKIGNVPEENLGYRVVLDLSENVPENTLIAFDNFFTSLGLMTALYEKKIFAVGTVRSNRKGLPEIIVKKSRELSLQPGEFIYQHAKPLSVLKWRDTKDVFVCTTAFDPTEVTIIKRTQKNGSKKEMFCPLAIKKYTEYMGGVDLFDHYRASYPLGKKSRKNWHRLFWFLLEAAVINSYIIYMQGHSGRRNTHKEFRLRLGRSLIDNYSSRERHTPVFKCKRGGVSTVPDEIRFSNVGIHMPKVGKYRRCRFCSTRAKEQRSKLFCGVCLVSLCGAPCFERFHLRL